ESYPRLGIATGELEDEPVLLFAQRQYQPARTIRFDREQLAPLAVWDLAQALAQTRFGVSNHLRRHAVHQLRSILAVHGPEPRLGHVVGGDFTLEIEPHSVGLAGHVSDRVEDIVAQLTPFHQLDAGNSKSLLKDLRGVRRRTAGR